MRTFIAVDITPEIRQKAVEIAGQLMDLDIDMKFTDPENLHFTLKFLGEVSDDRVNEIADSISAALAENNFKQFRVSVEGLGYFGNPNHIKTLWIDTGEGREELVKLASTLNASLDHVRHEEREPKPHLTIGRVKSGRNREALLKKIEELKHVKLGEMDVKLVKLKQSVLSSKGPTYTDLKVFELA